ncbi:uncharacterized protein LOC120645079 isoform X2 [Panicum virgatum]|uniref:uncharacterized protein LOC120645079 isoform X2 n=1 Tax=Panicum virgatum TaxID=38727 RepID=UPI0019D531D9|nr:uncharacterized protein LOC120645079 isoform X2 [Panicum virgatum]
MRRRVALTVCTAPQPSSNSKDAPRHNRPHTALPTMSARSFFRAAMFLLVQLAGIYLEHAAGFPSGCSNSLHCATTILQGRCTFKIDNITTPTMPARYFFRAAMFLLVQLAGIYLAQAIIRAETDGCTNDPSVYCPPDPGHKPCPRPPCPNS